MTSLNHNGFDSQTNLEDKRQKTSEMEETLLKDLNQENIQSRFDNIIKSRNDKSDYRGLILKNEMKILLISDPTTDKSAASLNVNVGSMNNPRQLPGLAHFCEHMLFMGTKKYPEENDYNKFLSQNGGSFNAFTDESVTNYYFLVNTKNLEGALDRFSQFFIDPLFNESGIEREILAVDSEFEITLKNDELRLSQLDKFSADSNHPYSLFDMGNKDTLKNIPIQNNINVRDELINFYEKWYSANIMTLSVLGKESLDDLERMVVKMFAEVENKNVNTKTWTEPPFNEEHFQHIWYIVPIIDTKNLTIIFPLPDLDEYSQSAPTRILSLIIGHEGKGSLLSALKAKSWCNSLDCEEVKVAKGVNFFNFQIELTEEGLNNINNIVTLIFQYINILKREGLPERIYIERRDLGNLNFQFEKKESTEDIIQRMATNLQLYPIEEVLSGSYLIKEYSPDGINKVLGYLTPQNIRIQVQAQTYENIATEVEPFYQTKFKKEKISEDIIKMWSDAGYNCDLQLPLRNEFIPTNLELKVETSDTKFPTIIHDTPLTRAWYKKDDVVLLPMANLTIQFVSPIVVISPMNKNNLEIFIKLFQDSLNEYVFDATEAGINWKMEAEKRGFKFTIEGFDDKQFVLLETIMDKMMQFVIDEERFGILKQTYIESLKNFDGEIPIEHAYYYLNLLLIDQVWSKAELLDACSRLTSKGVRNFISQMFTTMHVESLIFGNYTKYEALNIASLIESKLTSTNDFNEGNIIPLLPSQLCLLRDLHLEKGCHFLYQTKHKMDVNFGTIVFYQSDLQSTESNMLLKLFVQIISEPCFNTLRTIEQLGYIVEASVTKNKAAQGFKIVVQSDKNPRFVKERIDVFLKSMEDYIRKMSDEEFNDYKESLSDSILNKQKTMSNLNSDFWNEISSQTYNFDRANIEVKYLMTISKEQILEFYKDLIGIDSKTSRKLSIHVLSAANQHDVLAIEAKKSEEKEPIRISDILAFKKTQYLYPLLQPFTNIPKQETEAKI